MKKKWRRNHGRGDGVSADQANDTDMVLKYLKKASKTLVVAKLYHNASINVTPGKERLDKNVRFKPKF